MLKDCLDHIKFKKNAGALEDKGHHIEGQKQTGAGMEKLCD